ncbi:MAG: 2-C-methyl-D-erythritol 4-phosphate cytidylyltransferase [Pyrinomonadaceae bacterium]
MNVAIIPAAGQGLRMGGKRAKQFLKLDGIPVIIHTLKRFEQCPDIDQVVVVLPANDVKGFPALARRFDLRKVAQCIAGGKTRSQSVRLGLQSLLQPDAKMVAVHDGVRPFVTPEEISQTLRAAKRTGAAILVAPVTDTIKFVRGRTVLHTIPRDRFRRALTPQCFHYQLLRDAFQRAGSLMNKATDDSMLLEASGRVTFVEGNARNIKITGPEDLALAEIILQQNPEFRIKPF